MRWDWWEVAGLAGYGLFFARMTGQWLASEQAGRPVLPGWYWTLSLLGSVILVAYALHLGSFVILVPQIVGGFIYAGNLRLERRQARHEIWRAAQGFDTPTFPWPPVQVALAAGGSTEEAAASRASVSRQAYSGPTPAFVERSAPLPPVEDSVLILIDAGLRLVPDAAREAVEALHGRPRTLLKLAGRPERGLLGVRLGFYRQNRRARHRDELAPGGALALTRAVWDELAGTAAESPAELLMRARQRGMSIVFAERAQTITPWAVIRAQGINALQRRWQTLGVVPQDE